MESGKEGGGTEDGRMSTQNKEQKFERSQQKERRISVGLKIRGLCEGNGRGTHKMTNEVRHL